MSKFSSHVVLSPHPDDAVLSLGACINAWRRLGDAVTVVTVFDGSPPYGELTPAAIEDGARYDGDPVLTRQSEDRDAVAHVGAQLVSLGLPELVYRRRMNGVPRCQSLADIFGPLDNDDNATIDAVIAALDSFDWNASVVHVPLATGGHSDHRIVRAATERLQSQDWAGSIEFYDDMPYAWRESTHDPSVVWPALDGFDIDRWIDAIRFYPSQMATVFAEDPAWEQHFREWSRLKRP